MPFDFLQPLLENIESFRPFGIVFIVMAILGTAHVILYKRDARTSIAWIALIWLSPFVGVILYLILGINRIHRKASRLTAYRNEPQFQKDPEKRVNVKAIKQFRRFQSLIDLGDRLDGPHMVSDNSVTPFISGDVAFPEMLQAIEKAQKSITFMSYIFDADAIGVVFVKALAKALQRGVKVCVLIDGVGAGLPFRGISRFLRKYHIPHATFLPSYSPWRVQFLNLRNHRKLLVIDGHIAFTGGMNISKRYKVSSDVPFPVHDIQFRLKGPIVNQLQAVFAYDWQFATGKMLEGSDFFPNEISASGNAYCRSIPDGPDFAEDRIRWFFLGALSTARKNIRIMTPYFLPDFGLLTGLNTAALRGVQVDIIIPSKSDQFYMHWAMMGSIWQTLEKGCNVWLSPMPFEHTKIMIIDDEWLTIGSANWDVRSLRLNFELNVEALDPELCQTMIEYFENRKTQSASLNLSDVKKRSIPLRLRDGIARLFSPFL